MTYKYKRPDGELHKISIRKWNKAFANRGRWPFITAEVYLQNDLAEVHYVPSKFALFILVLFYPLVLLFGTVQVGLPEAYKDIRRVLFCKKYGGFGSDMVYKRKNHGWNKLMKLLGKGEDTDVESI